MNNIRLDQYFILREFQCRCCGVVKIRKLLLERLHVLRGSLKRPIIITSGYRCKNHNTAVGGKVNSAHMRGAAADIRVTRISPLLVMVAAKRAGFKNVYCSVAENFTHCGL